MLDLVIAQIERLTAASLVTGACASRDACLAFLGLGDKALALARNTTALAKEGAEKNRARANLESLACEIGGFAYGTAAKTLFDRALNRKALVLLKEARALRLCIPPAPLTVDERLVQIDGITEYVTADGKAMDKGLKDMLKRFLPSGPSGWDD